MPNQPPLPPKAAALEYDKDKHTAPKLTAKGKGKVAEKIVEVAKANNVPIHKDADLMEILDKVELEADIPLEVYAVVAEIFSYLYKVNQKQAQR